MESVNSNPSELLCREVLAEANRRREEIMQRAKTSAGQILADAQGRIERLRQEKLSRAEAEAARRAQAILASVATAANRGRSEQIEECLRLIHDQIAEALRALNGPDFRRAVIQAVAEALTHFRAEAFTMRISPEGVKFLSNGIEEEIRLHSERTFSSLEVSADPELKRGEVILQDRAGHQVWNVGLAARLERSWPGLRRQIAAQLLSAIQRDQQLPAP